MKHNKNKLSVKDGRENKGGNYPRLYKLSMQDSRNEFSSEVFFPSFHILLSLKLKLNSSETKMFSLIENPEEIFEDCSGNCFPIFKGKRVNIVDT